jgi:ABC-type Mn2+/Zn2+ transport system permease subunit
MNELWSLVALYQFTILAGIVTALALAWTGTYLATQARAAQTLCVSQGASLGVLMGMQAVCTFQGDEALVSSPYPALTGLFTAALIFGALDHFTRKAPVRNVVYIAFFSFLWALSPLLAGLFPRIDDHLTQVYFGDLVTLSESNTWLALAIASAQLFLLTRIRTPLTKLSFDIALTGSHVYPARAQGRNPQLIAFQLLTLILICFSVQFLGLLFTLGGLFLPTVILSRPARAGVVRHTVLSVVTAGLGASAGFVLSLLSGKLPTVPTVIVAMSGVGFLVRLLFLRAPLKGLQ